MWSEKWTTTLHTAGRLLLSTLDEAALWTRLQPLISLDVQADICSSWLQSPRYTYKRIRTYKFFKLHISECQVVSTSHKLQSTSIKEASKHIFIWVFEGGGHSFIALQRIFSHRSCLKKLMSVASCDRIKPEIPLTPFKARKNLLSINDIAAPTGSRHHFGQALCLSVEIRTLELFSWKKHTHPPSHPTTPNLNATPKRDACRLNWFPHQNFLL